MRSPKDFPKKDLTTHLHSRFRQTDPHRYFFSHKNIRIVGLGETPFELVQLGRGEPRPVSLLFCGFVAVVRTAPHRVPERRQTAVTDPAQTWLIQNFQFALVPFQVFAAHLLNACRKQKQNHLNKKTERKTSTIFLSFFYINKKKQNQNNIKQKLQRYPHCSF